MKRNGWWMYFVQGEHSKNVKIGIATCPLRRVASIQAACPERLKILGIARIVGVTEQEARDAESIIHHHFKAQRLHGEVFSPSAALLRLAKLKRVDSEHKCPRCVTIQSDEPLELVGPDKPIVSTLASKERHLSHRLRRPSQPRQSLYHATLPRIFFPRRDADEYGGTVSHLRPGISITDYSNRANTYKPSLG